MADVDGSRVDSPEAAVTTPQRQAEPEDCREENPTISVVQDSSAYLDTFHAQKDQNARWVRGLSYEDEVNALYTEYVRSQMRNHEGGEITSVQRQPQGNTARWLRYPVYCFVIYVLLLLQGSQDNFRAQYRREFPVNEQQLIRSGRLSGENFFAFLTRVLIPLCLPSLFLSGGAFMLALAIGSTTHHFVALCGVGLAALSWLAALAQGLTLWAACDLSSISNRWECSMPFLFYWLCSVMRVGSPLLSLWSVTPMLDLARRAGYRWRVLLALPALSFAAAVVIKMTSERVDSFHAPLTASYFLVMAVLAALTFTCWNQEPFEIVFRPVKLHAD